MGQFQRNDFSLGWSPSADAFNAPKNALLRMDNLVLDEIGAVALRHGSAKLSATAFTRTYAAFDYTSSFESAYFASVSGLSNHTSDFENTYMPASMAILNPANHNYAWEVTGGYISDTLATDTDVHSLYTALLNGTTYRMSGVTDAVYTNTAILSNIAGSGDIAFGAHQGHILFARSTTKKKFDGATVRNWGIAAPSGAPTLTAITAASSTLSTCTSAEAPGMTSNEGTQTFVNDRAGTGNAAVQLAPDATTGRAVSTKTFATATDFSGTDEDLLDFYTRVAEPQYVTSIAVMVDVNDGLFQEDYYERTFVMGDAVEIVPGAEESLASVYTVEGEDRDRVLGDIEDRGAVTVFRQDVPSGDTGWNHFSVPRSAMLRSGQTAGKNWATVKAVRLIVNAIAGGSGAAVRFDEIIIRGSATSPLTGKFKAAIVAVRNDGTYTALSGPSAFSSEIEVKAQGITATLSADVIAALDSQVTELWLYLMGGRLNAFYRFTVLTGGPFSGAQTISATTSEITALIADLRMETDNAVPPDSIIGIEGPHFDRTLVLTAQFVYPSRERNPDSFSAGQAVRVGSASETALWIKKANEQVYVGTTRDIYRIAGDWTVLPDGTVNVAKLPLGVSRPPVGPSVCIGTLNDAETLIYLTTDGWRTLQGPILTDGSVDLLWRGQTRHGVDYVNIFNPASRFRVAISKNVLFALTPEGSTTTSTTVIHAYHFRKQRWYRYVYPQAFRSIVTEPDGTVIAGDESGFVRQLDLVDAHLDDGANITVTLWTPVDDNGEPFTYKDPESLHLRMDTGGATAAVAFHLNGNNTADSSTTTAQSQTDTSTKNISTTNEHTQFQMRITGSFSTFVLRGWAMRYLDNPMPQVIHDTGPVDLSGDVLKWVRRVRVKAKSPVDLTVQPYWDGVAATTRTMSVGASAGVATVFDVPLGREDKARVGRIVITSASPSHIYWVRFEFNGSGKSRQKTIALLPEAV